ncbi:FCN1A-like protein, partial [Mya arenaria]
MAFVSTTVHVDANACHPSPCVHGSCFSGPAGYLCVCDHGYTGIHCDSSIGGIETCLSCPARLTDVPCTHVQKCSSGQQCFARILATSSGDLLHEYGCKDSQLCGARSVIGRRETPTSMTSRQTQTGFPLCERCCLGAICNMNMCGQAPNISVSGGPTCYSCSNHTTKDSCTDIQHCPAGQVCQLVPKISIATHTYHFESSCAVHAAFQRRVTNSPDFHRNLAEYKKGFGDINSNFWMGSLENLKEIVDLGPTDGKFHGVVVGANDSTFSEECTFTLRIISLSGAPSFTIEREANATFSCTGSISPQDNGQVDAGFVIPPVATFATYDRDTTDACAAHQGGGWWYYGCVPSNGSLPTNTYNNSNICGSHFYPGGQLPPDEDAHCAPFNLYSDRPSQ